jgi:hypothetical protein
VGQVLRAVAQKDEDDWSSNLVHRAASASFFILFLQLFSPSVPAKICTPDFSTSQGPIRTLKSRRNLTAMANKQNLILDVFTIIDDSICRRPNRN